MSSSRSPRPVPAPSGAGGTKASLYARFIPREELSTFAAWHPGDLADAVSDTEAAGVSARFRHHAGSGGGIGAGTENGTGTASRTTAGAAVADETPDAAEAVRAARQSGYQDGYRDGLVALEGFKQSFALQTTQQIGTVLQSIGEQLDALQQQMARALAVAATQLARQIVRNELTAQPAQIARVAEEAVDALLLSARHISVRVHPDDHACVAGGAAEVLTARGARLLAAASVERGGCRVESDIGVIDASIEARWRRASAALGCDEAWQAGDVGAPGQQHGA